jgi:hypothetical protein
MDRQEALFPLEFVVAATPISMQASAGSIKAWKEAISAAAETRIAETIGWTMLDSRPLSVTIIFCSRRAHRRYR